MSGTGARPVVLVLLGAFWPGNESSGPNQSFRALAEALRSRFALHLIARDRPFDASGASARREPHAANGFDETLHLQPGALGIAGLAGTIRRAKPDLLWLNGFFDREFTIPALVNRRLGRLGGVPTLLSPRGEFGEGALSLKSSRKRGYLAFARMAGLLRGVTLHATSEDERNAIGSALPWHDSFAVAANARALADPPARSHAAGGPLRIVFLGRISPVKNLHFALDALREIRTPAVFEIVGPVQDASYWRLCRDRIAGLPQHVRVVQSGELSNQAAVARLAAADLLFLPTKGENFGHAIFESLSAGTPVLISDATPWRGLEADEAGWDLPLADPRRFASAIDALGALDAAARERLSRGARRRAEAYARTASGVADTAAMLERLLAP